MLNGFTPPHLAPAEWPEGQDSLAQLAVERGRFLLRGASHVIRVGAQMMPGARTTRSKDHWTLSMPANRRSAAELSWLAQRFPIEIEPEFERYRTEAVEHARRTAANADLTPVTAAPGFEGDLNRYPWQPEDVARMVANPRCLNGLEMGLGKTVEALAAVAAAGAFPALIVAPPHLQQQWIREAGKFLRLEDEGSLFGPVAADQLTHRIKGLTPYDLPKAPLYVTHYGLLRGWAEELAGREWGAVVFDEAQELRIPGSQKYVAASAIAASAQRAWGLSGTPIYNYGGEIWAILDVLDRGCLGAWQDFAVQWCDDRGDGRMVTRPRELHDHLVSEGLLFRRRKRDLLPHLPPKRRVVVDLALNEDVYTREMAEVRRLARQIGEVEEGDFWSFRRDALLRVETGARQAAGLAKVEAVAEFVAGLAESGEAPMVAAHHTAVHDALMEALAPWKPVRVTGQESASQKNESVERFAAGRAGVILIALRSSAGLDGLQARATCTVAAELDFSPAVHGQFEDRAHRIGTAAHDELPCYYLTSSATYDEVVMELLGIKASQSRQLLDDPEESEDPAEARRRAAERIRGIVERLQEREGEPREPAEAFGGLLQ